MPLSATAIERLSKLADYMDTLKPSFTKRFDMRTWQSEKFCGTSGCAFGYSTRIPEFYNLGLRMMGGKPYYQGKVQWDAVCAFYDIDATTARSLFSFETGSFIKQPKEWAFHYREYLKVRGAQPTPPSKEFKKFMGKVLSTTV